MGNKYQDRSYINRPYVSFMASIVQMLRKLYLYRLFSKLNFTVNSLAGKNLS